MRVIGYGICGPNEANRYMRATMEEFRRLCDETVILCNNAGKAEKKLIREYGFKMVEDDREWGLYQNLIKQDFVTNHVAKLKPDWCVCLDMDEVFEPKFTRQTLERQTDQGWAFHFYIVELWNEGHKRELGFWNVRMWKWNGDTEFLNRPLHSGLAPKWAYFINQYAPFIVRHYGLKDKEDRLKKITRYEKYDSNAKYCSRKFYNTLATDDCVPYDEEKLHKEVDAYVKKYKPQVIKQPMTQQKRKFVLIKRTNRKTGEEFTFDVPEKDVKLYLSQSTPEMSFEFAGDVAGVEEELQKLFDEPEKVEEKPEEKPVEEPNVKSPFKKFVPKRAKRK